METKEQMFGDFKVRVRYSDVTAQGMHRYHIECVDMQNLIVVFSESNVIGNEYEIEFEKAVKLVTNYFLGRFNIDILNFQSKGNTVQNVPV